MRVAIGFIAFPRETSLFEQSHCEVIACKWLFAIQDYSQSLLLRYRYGFSLIDNELCLIQLAEDIDQIAGNTSVTDQSADVRCITVNGIVIVETTHKAQVVAVDVGDDAARSGKNSN